jgi:hypothetical protein
VKTTEFELWIPSICRWKVTPVGKARVDNDSVVTQVPSPEQKPRCGLLQVITPADDDILAYEAGCNMPLKLQFTVDDATPG